MTKAEIIERYGIEEYERRNEYCNLKNKARYHNDPEYRESKNARQKERYQNNSEFRESHKIRCKARSKERYQNDPEYHEYKNARSREHYKNEPEYYIEYMKNDLNSKGKTKNNIRKQSSYILFNKRHHSRLKGYEIHHAFGYDDAAKFIYIPRELHKAIHQFLRDNIIDADSNHFNSIAQLINECTEYTYISA